MGRQAIYSLYTSLVRSRPSPRHTGIAFASFAPTTSTGPTLRAPLRCTSTFVTMPSASLAERLSSLRQLMKEHNLDAYVVPSEDAHSSEYLAPCDARREFITGFTGSAGLALVTQEEARCWTDGRYFLQAEKELGPGWTLMKAGLPETPTWTKWLATEAPRGSRVGIDPAILSFAESQNLTAAFEKEKRDVTLVPSKENLVDTVWSDQPSRPCNAIFRLDEKYTGASVSSKQRRLREQLAKSGSSGTVVSQLDEVAWLLNLRGSDIPYNPVFFAYAILTQNECAVFTNSESIDSTAKAHLESGGVTVLPYDDIWSYLATWGEQLSQARRSGLPPSESRSAETKEGEAKNADPTYKASISGKTSWAIAEALGKDNVEVGRSLVEDIKAQKNATEMEGFRQCHIRDGAALVRYFAWLEEVLQKGEQWTEYDAGEELERFRKQMLGFKGLSFDTISSTGPNAAVIHYKAPSEGSAVIDINQVYLCDSGAQYLDGTTDTTRTMHFGQPSEEEKRAFTRVLQGHIAIDTAVFPQGTTGYILDPLARQFLWSDGLDYRHSTGHGVGSFLNVHEGPQGIGPKPHYNDTALQAGHVISNEPGYYADGKFGIRIENVMGVKLSETRNNFGNKGYLEFEHFTMAPIQTKLVDFSLLSPKEHNWLIDYNKEVEEKLTPILQRLGDTRAVNWLQKECEPVELVR